MDVLQSLFINGFFLCLAISLFLILYRLKNGPSLADRVVAADLFSTVLISAVAVAAIYIDDPGYFDIAMVWALFGFLGSVIFAKFIQSQEKQR